MEKKTILIVDDEERNIKLLKAYLSSDGYHLLEAHNGDEALRMVGGTCPDVILLDVMMPGIDGLEVCRRLKQDEKTRMIPVVIVTALQEKGHRIKAMEAGADDFLSKPVDQTELLVRVKSLLRVKTYHDDLLNSYREIAEKNERLQELERIKEGLTHMVIHDLRNPLTAISLSLEILIAGNGNLNKSQLEATQKCQSYCRDMSQLVQSILDIHKMEEGKLIPDKQLTDMAELIDEVFEDFRAKANTKSIFLHFPRPEGISRVRVDRGLIKRVIANLLNNAIRHSPEGEEIKVSVGFLPKNGGMCFSLKDNGNGLAPEYHEKIFDKFEQAGFKQANNTVGRTGLGLTFCKIAVEAHDGKIWVKSDGEGKGCTFSFAIPA
jgi:signal transduction histidine kinase